ncbi:MAG: RhuM family protein [Candidatus Cryosericum sp.]
MPNTESSKKRLNARPDVPGGDIVLYTAPDGTVQLDVRLERDSIWLSQQQMALLFDTERSVLSKHLKNIFGTGELDQESNVQKMHIAGADRPVAFYNLDTIIAVGYRVKSRVATQFRVWATNVLRDHLIKGYTANQQRLKELNQAIRLIADVTNRRELSGDEATALLRVVGQYSAALDLLDDYDYQRVAAPGAGTTVTHALGYDEAMRIVEHLRGRFGSSDLFGREKDNSLQSALGAVMQTWGGNDLYPGVEAKAANLLYFVVKNHAFLDGNKRIAAALFLWFLDKNNALYNTSGERRFSDAALVATTLLIAESKSDEKDVIVRIVSHLLSPGPRGTAS